MRTFAEHGVSFVEDRPVKDLEELRSARLLWALPAFATPTTNTPDLIAAEMLEFLPRASAALPGAKTAPTRL